MLERLHLRWQVVLCVGALQLAALGILGGQTLRLSQMPMRRAPLRASAAL